MVLDIDVPDDTVLGDRGGTVLKYAYVLVVAWFAFEVTLKCGRGSGRPLR
jgi:hypothetical protein